MAETSCGGRGLTLTRGQEAPGPVPGICPPWYAVCFLSVESCLNSGKFPALTFPILPLWLCPHLVSAPGDLLLQTAVPAAPSPPHRARLLPASVRLLCLTLPARPWPFLVLYSRSASQHFVSHLVASGSKSACSPWAPGGVFLARWVLCQAHPLTALRAPRGLRLPLGGACAPRRSTLAPDHACLGLPRQARHGVATADPVTGPVSAVPWTLALPTRPAWHPVCSTESLGSGSECPSGSWAPARPVPLPVGGPPSRPLLSAGCVLSTVLGSGESEGAPSIPVRCSQACAVTEAVEGATGQRHGEQRLFLFS